MSEQKKINVLRGRKISLEAAKLIGVGGCSKVYLLPDDNVVKVLNIADFNDAEKEIQLAKWAFSKGIPTPISYDVVDIDGYPGLVYESLGKGNLRNLIKENPDSFISIMERYVAFLRKINSIEGDEKMVPSSKQKTFSKLNTIKKYFSEKEFDEIIRLVNTIPEDRHLIHGDCHVKNIRVVKNEFYLIDLDTLSMGDPIFELMGLCCCYHAYSNKDETGYDIFFDIDGGIIQRVYQYILDNYYPNISEEAKRDNIKKIELFTYIIMLYNLNPDNPKEKACFDDMFSRVKARLFTVNDFILNRQ